MGYLRYAMIWGMAEGSRVSLAANDPSRWSTATHRCGRPSALYAPRRGTTSAHQPRWYAHSAPEALHPGTKIEQQRPVWGQHKEPSEGSDREQCRLRKGTLCGEGHARTVRGIQGRGGFCQGNLSPLRKVAKFSPGEILAQQFHPSPQLQALCFLRRARRDYERA